MAAKGQLTGMTGVYLVAAELTRRGFIASPTSRNVRGADILVTDEDCKYAYSIQVKTNGKSESFWLLDPHAKDMVSPSHFYVLVNLIKDGAEFYVVTSEIVADWMDIAKQGQSTWYSITRENVKEFKDRWDQLREPEKSL